MKTSDLFIKALENEGVEYIFGIPGEENLDFLESLIGSSIELVLTRHEQAAGFMAATYGRLTGKPGVCLSTLGPGATNFVTSGRLRPVGGHADGDAGRSKTHKEKQAGAFSDRGCSGFDASNHQIIPATGGRWRQHPCDGQGCLPDSHRRKAQAPSIIELTGRHCRTNKLMPAIFDVVGSPPTRC